VILPLDESLLELGELAPGLTDIIDLEQRDVRGPIGFQRVSPLEANRVYIKPIASSIFLLNVITVMGYLTVGLVSRPVGKRQLVPRRLVIKPVDPAMLQVFHDQVDVNGVEPRV
jgi:hypothetical protein